MVKRRLIAILVLVVSISTIVAVMYANGSETVSHGTLIWADEFNGPKNSLPNSHTWTEESGYQRNNEQQFYTVNDPNTASMTGTGSLKITVNQTPTGNMQYSSASLTSENKKEFKYGYFEARIKTPSTNNIWPAWWLESNNNPQNGEIDIMEQINTQPGNDTSVHGGSDNWSRDLYSASPQRDPNAWHVYGAKVSPGLVQFYVDGILVYSVSKSDIGNNWPFDTVSQFMHLNVAYGGDWPGSSNIDSSLLSDHSVLPASMYVDYVRVYSYN